MKRSLIIFFTMISACENQSQYNKTQGQATLNSVTLQKNAAVIALSDFKQMLDADKLLQKSSFVLIDSMAIFNDSIVSELNLSNLTLGLAIPTALIRIDSLKKFSQGKNISGLLVEGGQIIFPIFDQQAHHLSTLTIENKNEQWQTTGYGLEKEVIKDALPFLNSQKNSLKLLKIPSLHVYFLSYQKENITYFIPLQEDKEKGLEKGKEYKAENVLQKYIQTANLYNGLPR